MKIHQAHRSMLSAQVSQDWTWATVGAHVSSITATSAQTSDTTTDISSVFNASIPGGSFFGGAVLLPSGNICLTPYGNNDAKSKWFVIYDPVGNTIVNKTAWTNFNTKRMYSAFLLPDGRVFSFVYNSDPILYDPVADTQTYITSPAYASRFGTTIVGGNNDSNIGYTHLGEVIFYMYDGGVHYLQLYNPITNTTEEHIPTGLYGAAYRSPTELIDGSICLTTTATSHFSAKVSRSTWAATELTGMSKSWAYQTGRLIPLPDNQVLFPGAGVTTHSLMSMADLSVIDTGWTQFAAYGTLLPNRQWLGINRERSVGLRKRWEVTRTGWTMSFGYGDGCRPLLTPAGKVFSFSRSTSYGNHNVWDGQFSECFNINALTSPWFNASY